MSTPRCRPVASLGCRARHRSALTTAYRFGVKCKLAWANPAEGVETLAITPRSVIWPKPAVAAFVARADARGVPALGDAILLAAELGQR